MTTELAFSITLQSKSSYPLFPDTRCSVSAEASQHCRLWMSDGVNRVLFCISVVASNQLKYCMYSGVFSYPDQMSNGKGKRLLNDTTSVIDPI